MANTVAMAWVHFRNAPSELYLKSGANGSLELVSQAASASIGDVAGQVITGIDVQCSDGTILNYLQITGSDGSQVLRVLGSERVGAGGHSENSNLNLCVHPLSILVERGMTLNTNTSD